MNIRMRIYFVVLLCLTSLLGQSQVSLWKPIKSVWETGVTGEWNIFGRGTDPFPYHQWIGCKMDRVQGGVDGAPVALSPGQYMLRRRYTDSCQRGLYTPLTAPGPIDAYWASQNKVSEIKVLLENHVPTVSNPDWQADTINRGDEAGIFRMYVFYNTGLSALPPNPTLTQKRVVNTIASPGMAMEWKQRFQYNGQNPFGGSAGFDDAQFQVNIECKETIIYKYGHYAAIDNFTPSRADAPLIYMAASWMGNMNAKVHELPLGQWVKLEARIYPQDSVCFYVNDTLVNTYYHSDVNASGNFPFTEGFPYVGIRPTTGTGGAGTSTTRSYTWTAFATDYAEGVHDSYMDSVTYYNNVAPNANAGINILIHTPVSSTTLNGSASVDSDAAPAWPRYQWVKLTGPSGANITSPTSASTGVTSLSAGTYTYELTVTDDFGAVDKDTVQLRVNASPTANAGSDVVVLPPFTSVTLNASSSADSDGSIASYSWTKISGPAGTSFDNANIVNPNVLGLSTGTFVFRVTVTDNEGGTSTDDVTVRLNAAPTSDAGTDILIHLPTTEATLSGSGTDADGTVTYLWSKISGPASSNIVSPTLASTPVNTLAAGTYVFRLTVTDNDGSVATDNVQIIVNQLPIANAGIDITLSLPTMSTGLTGSSSSDPDGSIASYSWTKLSGPTYTINNAGIATPTISNLQLGTYVFQLTVTDNRGATSSDNVTVLVLPGGSETPEKMTSPVKKIIRDPS